MTADSRHQRILDLLAGSGYQSVPALARSLRVSGMTIRRDLDLLERRGALRRTYGGAVASGGHELSVDYAQRRGEHRAAKERIAASAAGLVKDGQTIYLDAGTSVLALAERLADASGLTIVTNSLPIANALSAKRGLTVHVLGGELRPDLLAMIGPLAEQGLAAFRLDVAFLGATCVDLQRGLSRAPIEEIPLKCQAARQAERVVVLATRAKIGAGGGGMVYLAADAIDTVVTDTADGAERIRVRRR